MAKEVKEPRALEFDSDVRLKRAIRLSDGSIIDRSTAGVRVPAGTVLPRDAKVLKEYSFEDTIEAESEEPHGLMLKL